MLVFRVAFKAMGCPCEIRVYAESEALAARITQAGRDEITRLETKYSRYRDDSLTARIQRSAGDARGVTVDDETAALLDYGAQAHEQSQGLFDLTSGVLRRAWNFRAAQPPTSDAIQAILPMIGWKKLQWQRPQLRLPEGMELDFGGLVKEYAADCAARLCRDAGAQHGLVDLGGDIAVIGPHPDGSPWHVGIRHPRKPETAIASIELASGAIASSGDYERFIEYQGRRYGHVLNPISGWPVEGLSSVSVLAEHCLIAGTASTIAMLKGATEGPRWLAELGLPHFYVARDGTCGGTLNTPAATGAQPTDSECLTPKVT